MFWIYPLLYLLTVCRNELKVNTDPEGHYTIPQENNQLSVVNNIYLMLPEGIKEVPKLDESWWNLKIGKVAFAKANQNTEEVPK